MSKFQLAVENTLDFPVNVDVPSGRAKKNFFFHLSAPRMSTDEWRAKFGPNADNPNQAVGDFLREHITDWRGQRLVLDEQGKPADFSAEAFDAMLSVNGLEMLIFIAYQKAVFANDGDAGRRKNSAS